VIDKDLCKTCQLHIIKEMTTPSGPQAPKTPVEVIADGARIALTAGRNLMKESNTPDAQARREKFVKEHFWWLS
jgi:hypothetical protein